MTSLASEEIADKTTFVTLQLPVTHDYVTVFVLFCFLYVTIW